MPNTIELTAERYEELLQTETKFNLIINIYDDDSPWKLGDIIKTFKSEQHHGCKCAEKQAAAIQD